MLKGIICDLDGTVLDNEDVYGEAFRTVLLDLGVEVEEKKPHTRGIGVGPNWEEFIKKYNIQTNRSIEELTLETQKTYYKLIDKVELMQGFPEFAYGIKAHGVRLALATSNSAIVAQKITDKFLLNRFFDEVTTFEEVDHPKPDPSLFLKSAEKLNLHPEECVVVEDAVAGIEAARRAGMKVVSIADPGSPAFHYADLSVRNFTELSYEKIASLI